jgi:predicted RNA-binding protein with PUA-like domain
MRYWLFKSEPSTFSIDDLSQKPAKTSHWDGVRNYQVRNLLRDVIKPGDQAFFYHSSCPVPGIVGIMEVMKAGYPDFTSWDLKSEGYDPKSTAENPRWYMVDVCFKQKFKHIVTLETLKKQPQLKNMIVIRPGNRLSITSVAPDEWKLINKLAQE